MIVDEDSGYIQPFAQATQSAFGWLLEFTGDAGVQVAGSAYGQGVYLFDFKVSEPCSQLLLDPADIYPPTLETSLNVKSPSATNDRIMTESQ